MRDKELIDTILMYKKEWDKDDLAFYKDDDDFKEECLNIIKNNREYLYDYVEDTLDDIIRLENLNDDLTKKKIDATIDLLIKIGKYIRNI